MNILPRRRLWSAAERRLLRMSGPELNAQNLQNIKTDLQSEDTEKSAKEKEADARVDELVRGTNRAIAENGERLRQFPAPVQQRFLTELQDFMKSTVGRFDQNGVKGLSLQEFQDFQKSVEEQVRTVLAVRVNETANKAEQEEKQRKAKEERENRTLDDVHKLIEERNIELTGLEEIDVQALQNTNDPEGMQRELVKYQTKVQRVQKIQAEVMELGEHVSEFHEKAEKQSKSLDANASTIAGQAATGAAIGAAAGAWFFGVGAIVGAGVGAGVALVGGLIAAGVTSESRTREKEQLQAKMKSAKDKFAQKKNQADEVRAKVEQDGKTMNAAPASLREKIGKETETFQKDMAENKSKTQTETEARTKQRVETAEIQRKLEMYRKTLDLRSQETEKQTQGMTKAGEEIAKTQENQKNRGQEIQNALTTVLQARAQLPSGDERVAKLDKQIAALQAANKGVQEQSQKLQKGEALLKQGLQAGTQQQTELRTESAEAAQKSLSVSELLSAIDQTLPILSEHQYKLAAAETGGAKSAAERLAFVNDINQEIGKSVFQSNMELAGTQHHMEEMNEKIGKLAFAEGSFMDGIKMPWLDHMGKFLKENLGPIGHVVAFPGDVIAGIGEGLGGMAEGIHMMWEHPDQALKGLGALIGRNPETGEWFGEGSGAKAWEGWKGMVSGFFGGEDMARGDVGKGVGKAIMNIAMTATGASAFSTGANTMKLSFQAARAAGGNVITSSVRAGAMGVRAFATELVSGVPGAMADTVKGIASIPGSILKAPVSLYNKLTLSTVDKLGRSIAAQTEHVADLGKNVTSMLERSPALAPLAGKSGAELALLTGGELAQLGIEGAGNLRAFVKLKNAATELDHARSALQLTQHKHSLAQIGEGLEKLPSVLGKENKLRKFIDRYNTKNIPDPEKAFQILDSVPGNGGLVAFDSTGMLTVIPVEGMTDFIAQAQRMSRSITRSAAYPAGKPLLKIPQYADAARVHAAEALLGRPLNAAESQSLLGAHYNTGGLRVKAKELRSAGFEMDDIDKLMRSGVCGDAEGVQTLLKPKPGSALKDTKIRGNTKVDVIADNLQKPLTVDEILTSTTPLSFMVWDAQMGAEVAVTVKPGNVLRGKDGSFRLLYDKVGKGYGTVKLTPEELLQRFQQKPAVTKNPAAPILDTPPAVSEAPKLKTAEPTPSTTPAAPKSVPVAEVAPRPVPKPANTPVVDPEMARFVRERELVANNLDFENLGPRCDQLRTEWQRLKKDPKADPKSVAMAEADLRAHERMRIIREENIELPLDTGERFNIRKNPSPMFIEYPERAWYNPRSWMDRATGKHGRVETDWEVIGRNGSEECLAVRWNARKGTYEVTHTVPVSSAELQRYGNIRKMPREDVLARQKELQEALKTRPLSPAETQELRFMKAELKYRQGSLQPEDIALLEEMKKPAAAAAGETAETATLTVARTKPERTARYAQELRSIDPALEPLMELTTKPDDLARFVEQYNAAHPAGHAAFADKIIGCNTQKSLIAFDESGKLKLIPQGEIRDFFRTRPVAIDPATGRYASQFLDHADKARVFVAEQMLGRKISAPQRRAILRAQVDGTENLATHFSPTEIETLYETGIVTAPRGPNVPKPRPKSTPAPAPSPSPAPAPKTGAKIATESAELESAIQPFLIPDKGLGPEGLAKLYEMAGTGKKVTVRIKGQPQQLEFMNVERMADGKAGAVFRSADGTVLPSMPLENLRITPKRKIPKVEGPDSRASQRLSQHMRDLETHDNTLGVLPRVARDSGQLENFVSSFNGMSHATSDTFRILHTGPGGSLVVFDAQGKLSIMHPSSIPTFLENARLQAGSTGKLKIGEYADGARKIVTEQLKQAGVPDAEIARLLSPVRP